MSNVAVLRTSPETIFKDYHTLINLVDYQHIIAKEISTILKINITWHHYFPGVNTTPWQLEGVIRAMLQDGYNKERIHACHNRTVVIDSYYGEKQNKHLNVVEKYNLDNVHLYEEAVEWVNVKEVVGDLSDTFLVLNKVYPDGFRIPKRFAGENIIHFPTIKTHVFTTTTGAMKNAFGGLLNERRHWTHEVIHETLVDLLMIQQKIHPGILAVMDGTIAGDGPGPRCLIPHEKNIILASQDQVAIDAIAAKMMGIDPMGIKYIRLAHEKGLGVGNPAEIEVLGDKIAAAENWNFIGPYEKMTFASRMQHKIYWGPLKKPLEWTLKTILAPWSYIASVVYHDMFWYQWYGIKRVKESLSSAWVRMFVDWEKLTQTEDGVVSLPKMSQVKINRWQVFLKSLEFIWYAIKEAPEVMALRKKHTEKAGSFNPGMNSTGRRKP